MPRQLLAELSIEFVVASLPQVEGPPKRIGVLCVEKPLLDEVFRLVRELGGRIASIILYGSEARGETHEESDLDILIITAKEDKEAYRRSSQIRTRIDLANGTLTSLLLLSRMEFQDYLDQGSPLIRSILKEGVALYDDGTFSKASLRPPFKELSGL